VLFLDEPTLGLDPQTRGHIWRYILDLREREGVTLFLTTHYMDEAEHCDRIAIMKEGRIQQLGSPRDVFTQPANTFVAGFVGSTPMNLHPATVSGQRVKVAGSSVPLPASAEGQVSDGDNVVWGARPEYLRWSSTSVDDAIEGGTTVVENLGASVLVTVEADDALIQVIVDEDDEPAPGTRGWVVPRADRTLLFDADSGELLRNPAPRPATSQS
jgi:multiple sugar transport system ATP-binding protein